MTHGGALGEAHLIDRFFRPLQRDRADVPLGIGDDAALLRVADGCDLVATVDSLVEHRHFLPGAAAHSLGHRALAVSLSDLAAMGARPAWALLALTLPDADEAWLAEFARGFDALAQHHQVALVGGNLARGPFNISVQALGQVPRGTALRRAGAAPGDLVYVTGTPGDAAGGRLAVPAQADLQRRFLYPMPRVEVGEALRGIASACIDVSDGLAADLESLAKASGARALLEPGRVPLSQQLCAAVGGERALQLALEGGEDYELCFTVPQARQAALSAALAATPCPITQIGRIVEGPAGPVRTARGFDHFA